MVRPRQERLHEATTGTTCGAGTTTAAARSSRTICSTSTSRLSIRRHRRRRPRRSCEIVNASRSPEDAELADALDLLAGKDQPWPTVVTVARIVAATSQSDFIDYLKDRRNSRKIPHRFEACGYTPVRNPDADDGLWAINGRRQVIYARSNLTIRDRIAAAAEFLKLSR